MDNNQMTKEAFIEAYVHRCRSVGFLVEPTPDGCHYLADEDDPEIWMIAVPCHCCDHTEGWHMEEVESGEGKLHV